MDDYRKGELDNMQTTVGQCLYMLGHADVYRESAPPPVQLFDKVSTVAGRRKVRKFLAELETVAQSYDDVRTQIIAEYSEKDDDGNRIFADEAKTMLAMNPGWNRALDERLAESIEIDFVPFTESELGESVTFGETKRLGSFVVAE